ncbi:hypothetical protein ACLMJK_007680 [Lecanora helva]
MLDRMSVADQEAVRLGIEHICEKFPRFRKPEFRELVQFHQCYQSSEDDEVREMLQEWLGTEDGERAKSQSLDIFQISLAPEELALTVTDLLFFWCLDPPKDKDDAWSAPTDLIGLGQLLSKSKTLKQSYLLLLELLRSLRHAVKSQKKEESLPIMYLLEQAAFDNSDAPTSADLYTYAVQRLNGKSDSEAITANLDQVFQDLSLPDQH